ncbi:hypothetical protein NC652_032032 [Populus alba x Populus x berolinensis]|nr:hypothetical protein NC652_032032 [Populus alba x Populus x berolinensis]
MPRRSLETVLNEESANKHQCFLSFCESICAAAGREFRAVITTELHFLISKEFSAIECPIIQQLPCIKRDGDHCLIQLDKALYEEEKQLVTPGTEKGDSLQKELAVRAAAASIYSTCNFLTSKENVSCF